MFAVGGRGPLLSGSSAALSLLVPALIGALVIDPRFLAADGRPAIPFLLAFVAFGVVLAGMMQVLLASLRLGGLVRYVPYPVHAGYMNGVAVLMVMAMLPHILGLPYGQSAATGETRSHWRRWLRLPRCSLRCGLRNGLDACQRT